MDALPTAGDKVLYVLHDFETTQNVRYADNAKLHAPDLVCVQQFCAQARMRKTETACDAASERTRSGTILSGTFKLI